MFFFIPFFLMKNRNKFVFFFNHEKKKIQVDKTVVKLFV